MPKSLAGEGRVWGNQHITGDLIVDGTFTAGSGGAGITSINGSTVAAQSIVAGGTNTTVSSLAGTTTITALSTSTPTAGSIPQWGTDLDLSANSFIPSTNTNAGNLTLTAASPEYISKIITSNSTISLPATANGALPLGRKFVIAQRLVIATGLLTINAFGGTTLVVAGGSSNLTMSGARVGIESCEYTFTCVDNSPSATDLSSWSWTVSSLSSQDLTSYAVTTVNQTLLYTSPRNITISGTIARLISLPSTLTISVGTMFSFRNTGTVNMQVRSFDLTVFLTLLPGTYAQVRSVSQSDDTAAGWLVL